MGCGSSTGRRALREPMSIPLSDAQKYLVRETWETIDLHTKAVGKKTFLRFFDANPEYQKLFPEFVTLNRLELEQANALHGHAKRVMKAVANAVTALDDSESFSAYLETLGERHKSRALKPVYLDAMQTAFIEVIKDLLKAQWTPVTAEAWNKLFRFIADTMKRGLTS